VTFGAAAPRPVRFEPSREAVSSAAQILAPAWSRALAAFRRADAAVAALQGTPDDDAFNRAADAHDRALERLLLTPVPNLAALAEKLRQARVNQAWELPTGDSLTAALEQDAVRLSSSAAA
jgi:hypothetical protein